MHQVPRGGPSRAWPFIVVAAAAFLPFARGVLSGHGLYFRDLSLHFFPLRRFIVEGLRKGELRYWNPYVHEGIPVSLPPVSYPLDLLQLLLPSETGFSLLLTLHVPLAAVAFMVLARGLGLSVTAAAGGGLVYALGGFCLSSVNLYVYLQALAWAPLLILGLLRAAHGGSRDVALSTILTAVALSTTGFEVVLQAILVGVVLAFSRPGPSRWARLGASLALGFGLAAVTILYMRSLVADTARAGGFSSEVTLAHSIHPVTFLQTVIGGLYGDLSNLADRWWGSNFFPRGFPYLLSLYLGATVLAVAGVGLQHGAFYRRRLVLLAILAGAVGLGRWAGLQVVADAVPFVRIFRYPSKAFFTVHLAVALLVALGFDALTAREGSRPWRRLAWLGIGFGALLGTVPLLPLLFPGVTRWLVSGFFPPGYAWSRRMELAHVVLRDAALGGLVAAVAGFIAILVVADRIRPVVGSLIVAGLMTADLLRSGAGLNPMVAPGFFNLSPDMATVAASLRAEGGRIFTYDPTFSAAYQAARGVRVEDHEVWTFATLLETLTPSFNVPLALPSAYSQDLTMLVPLDRVLQPERASVSSFPALATELRRAGVAHVLSLDPIDHLEPRLRAMVAPRRLLPLSIRVYRLHGSLPLREVARDVRIASHDPGAAGGAAGWGSGEEDATAVEGIAEATTGASGRVVSLREDPGRLEMVVEADRPTVVVVRDAYAPGWLAKVDGSPIPVLRADARHRAVPVPAGLSRLVLFYRPPGLFAGLGLTLGSAGVLLLLIWSGAPRRT